MSFDFAIVDCAGSSSANSIASTWETGSTEEDGGTGSRGGSSTNSGVMPPQTPPKSIGEVRGILEHNRMLIQEISQNQETCDADGLTRNVSLIRELNAKMARVVGIYGEMSSFYAHVVATKKAAAASAAAVAAGGDNGAPERPRSPGDGQQ